MKIKEDRINQIINEELTKAEVETMVTNKLDSKLSSRDFKKIVKELSAEVVNEIFKTLWQKNNFWRNSATRV